MTAESSSTTTKVCPTCGSRLSENATRCLVCGRNFTPAGGKKAVKAIREPRMPALTLSLPAVLGMIVLVLAIGAGSVFMVLQTTGRVVEPTTTATPTVTATQTLTPTVTATSTPVATATPLPPLEYTVQSGDYCSSIALAFDVSVNSIILLNKLSADCTGLVVGQTLLIPQPTPTASPQPTSTLSGVEATDVACEKYDYTVTANDTLSGIAGNFNVSMEAIKEYNALPSDTVYEGMLLKIPLCRRNPTAGPTPTATPPPPYPAPNLLLPADGAAFLSAGDTITLQWSSVGALRENESYVVVVEDLTEGMGRKLTEYVTDMKFIIPASFRPADTSPHIYRWTISVSRQSGSTKEGDPIWVPAGTASQPRVFSWVGAASGAPVETTPAP